MSRLVVVSNRIADPRKTAAGGLAVALGEVLNKSGGLWFGWSGKIIEPVEGGVASEGELHRQQAGPVTLATVDLSREDHDAYYLGYSNGVLWPVFHYRLDLANFDAGFIAGYRRVNQLFARRLMPLLQPDDVIWIHDYHLIPHGGRAARHGLHEPHWLLLAHPAAAAADPGGHPAARLADAGNVCL
jgi:trehalose 6-phosphate synthase